MTTNKAAEAALNGEHQHGWNASFTNEIVRLLRGVICVTMSVLCKCVCSIKRDEESDPFFLLLLFLTVYHIQGH